jgi:hypothetical protein
MNSPQERLNEGVGRGGWAKSNKFSDYFGKVMSERFYNAVYDSCLCLLPELLP